MSWNIGAKQYGGLDIGAMQNKQPDPISGSGAFSMGHATVASAGTYTPPAKTCSSSIVFHAISISSAGFYAPQVKSAIGAITAGTISIAGIGSCVPPVKTGSGAISLSPAAISSTGSHIPPPKTGSGSIALKAITIAGAGITWVEPIPGSGAITTNKIGCVGAGHFATAGSVENVVFGSSLIFALLPKCLQLGTNPAPITSGLIPVFRGLGNGSLALIHNIAQYDSGGISFPRGMVHDYLNVSNAHITISPTTGLSVEAWFIYGGRDFGVVGTSDPDFNFQIFQPDENGGDYACLYAVITTAGVDYGYVLTDMFKEYFVQGNLYHLVIVAENTAGTINLRVYINGVEAEYFDSLPLTVSSVSISNGSWNIFETYGPDNVPSEIETFELYNEDITDRIAAHYALGPSLGGALGFDNGDGTMWLGDWSEHEIMSDSSIITRALQDSSPIDRLLLESSIITRSMTLISGVKT